jgi:sodium/bile acid cotransporter 7
VLTPLWLGAVLQSGGHSLPLGDVILDLVKWLVLPLALGQVMRPWLGAWAVRNKKRIHLVDRATILLLVYTSFCDSVAGGVWTGRGVAPLLLALAVSAGLFYAVLWASGAVCDALGFSREDRVAAVFCGSKKTLASGVPMAQLIFAGHPGLSLILLPLMIYHPLQLVLCGALASRWAKGADESRAPDAATASLEDVGDPAD